MAGVPKMLLGESSASAASRTPGPNRLAREAEIAKRMEQLLLALYERETRDQALRALSSDTEIRDHLAPWLWESFGTIAILLQEIIVACRLLSSPNLTPAISTKISHVLALFKLLATHPSTMMPFVKAKMPPYIYPFMLTKNRDKSHEYLRAASLGVVGALAKSEDPVVIHFLLESEVIPGCLHSLEFGADLSKTVAAFTVHKILLKEEGLRYFSALAERFFALCRALGQATNQLILEPSAQQLKYIIACYLQLSNFPRLSEGLKHQLPRCLLDNAFANQLADDPGTKRSLEQLINNVRARCFNEQQMVPAGFLI